MEHGDKRGRALGFPTANVAVPEDSLLPADGIYAGWYERPTGEVVAGAASLGRRPTFYESQPFRCSRPTCSISTATCTASGPRCGSWPDFARS